MSHDHAQLMKIINVFKDIDKKILINLYLGFTKIFI